MPQVLGADNIPNPVVASTTSLTLAATNKGLPTAYTIGGQQYSNTSTLTLNTATTGAGGLDTGTLGAIQLWYVYAIRSLSTFQPALIASLAGPGSGPAMPSGYGTAWCLVAAFYTNGSSQVGAYVPITGTAETGWMSYTPIVTNMPTSSVIGIFRRVADSFSYQLAVTSSGAATSTISISTVPNFTHSLSPSFGLAGQAQATKSAVGYTGGNIGLPDATHINFVSISGGLNWGPTVPFTWANADSIQARFTVQINELAGRVTLL